MPGKNCPGGKIKSKGKGRGMGRGKGKGPRGVPYNKKAFWEGFCEKSEELLKQANQLMQYPILAKGPGSEARAAHLLNSLYPPNAVKDIREIISENERDRLLYPLLGGTGLGTAGAGLGAYLSDPSMRLQGGALGGLAGLLAGGLGGMALRPGKYAPPDEDEQAPPGYTEMLKQMKRYADPNQQLSASLVGPAPSPYGYGY